MGDNVKVYDEMFNLIGVKDWEVVHREGLLHQVVHLWIYSDTTDGRWLFFIQRSADRKYYPDLYDLPISGHIDPEETFSEAIERLYAQQFGAQLSKENMTHVGNHLQVIDDGDYHDNAFCQVYVSKINEPYPEFKAKNIPMFFKARYDDFCRFMKADETIPIYDIDGRKIRDAYNRDWWSLRKGEFRELVKPYIDAQ